MDKIKTKKTVKKIFLGGLAVILCLISVFVIVNLVFLSKITVGHDFKNSFSSGYKGKTALIFVPHEDDELLVAGGLIKSLVDEGCKVKIAFTTNGDKNTSAQNRINEEIASSALLGVDKKDFIFLGYPDYNGIYNDRSGELYVSEYSNKSSTFCIPGTKDFHSARFGSPAEYTRANMLFDIKTVILDIKADIIFAIDFDNHRDHRAASLFFEEAMGEILKEDDSYRPIVLKSLSYNTGWSGVADFPAINIKATQKLSPDRIACKGGYELDMPAYNWEDRVRLPIPAEMCEHFYFNNLYHKAFSCHVTQGGFEKAKVALNSDEVFWRRRTDSFTYKSTVTVSSGNAKYINDFKLIDTDNTFLQNANFTNCVWTPESKDKDKSVMITFDSPKSISGISLYDDFSLSNNIKSGTLVFSDGSSVTVGALKKNGSQTIISFPEKQNITSFKFIVGEFEGKAGLTEIEAFSEPVIKDIDFVKIIDKKENNFMYNYFVDNKTGELELDIYSVNKDSEYTLTINGKPLTEKTLKFDKEFRNCTIRAEQKDKPEVFDEVKITRLSNIEMKYYNFIVRLDTIWQSNNIKILKDIKSIK